MTKIVLLAALGLCEHCGVLLSLQGMPLEAIDAEWKCPKCNKVINNKSFGYEQSGKKVKWVGKDGKWTNVKPDEDFKLGNLEVRINPSGIYI